MPKESVEPLNNGVMAEDVFPGHLGISLNTLCPRGFVWEEAALRSRHSFFHSEVSLIQNDNLSFDGNFSDRSIFASAL